MVDTSQDRFELDGASLIARLAHLHLVDVIPVAVLVIDLTMTIVYVNEQLVDTVGVPREKLLGRSAADFIDPRDASFALELVETGTAYEDSLMGPARLRYLDADGTSHWTQFWSYRSPERLGIDGYVIALSVESVRDLLAEAVAMIARGEELDRTMAQFARAARGAPLDGSGTVLLVEGVGASDADCFRALGGWPLDPELVNAYGTPWRRALVQGVPQDIVAIGLPDVDPRVGAAMATSGFRSAWIRPIITGEGDVEAVFVVWRSDPGEASPNEEAHLADAAQLCHLAIAQDRQRRALERAAHRDPLTGVGNRASLNDRLDTERRHPDVLFVDLDHFKAVNDSYGHPAGDEVIRSVGRRLVESVRRGDEVYRTGGDEFVVVCDPVAGSTDDLLALADRIIERLNAPFDVRGRRIRIGATVGIAEGDGRSLIETVAAADRAMYSAKERGGNCWHHADRVT